MRSLGNEDVSAKPRGDALGEVVRERLGAE